MPATDSQKLNPVSGSAQSGGEVQNGVGMSAVNNKSLNAEHRNGTNNPEDNNNAANTENNRTSEPMKNTEIDNDHEDVATILEDQVTFIAVDPAPDVQIRVPPKKKGGWGGKRRPAALLGPLKMNVRLVGGITCVTLGLILVIFSLGVVLNFDATFRWILGRRVVLSATSQGFPIWKAVSNNYDTKVAWHFFNLTNPEEFKQGAMPIVKEVGPFWYKVNLTKRNIVFHKNKTVSFEEHRFFTFDPVNSVASEDTNITMVNVPLMAALHKGEPMGYFARSTFGITLASIEQAQNATEVYQVRELTYTGQPNTLVRLSSAKDGIGSIFSDDAKKTRFGFGVDKNDTNPGVFNMYTGATGVTDLNRIHSDNGEHIRSIWPEDRCNVVDGTLGNLRPPMNETNSQVVYVPDMCRTVITRYQKDVDWHKIRLRRFNLTIDNFQSSEENPANSCYDANFKQPSGVFEVGPCKKGAPILMSLPHFMQADPKFRKDVSELSPEQTKHEFIMDHEPTTGMTVRVRGRVQANIRVIPSDLVTDAENLPTVTMPLFWQEMYVEGGPGIVAFLTKVNGYPGLGKIAMTIIALFGLILAVIGAGLLITSSRAQRKSTIQDPNHKVAYTKAATTEPRVDI